MWSQHQHTCYMYDTLGLSSTGSRIRDVLVVHPVRNNANGFLSHVRYSERLVISPPERDSVDLAPPQEATTISIYDLFKASDSSREGRKRDGGTRFLRGVARIFRPRSEILRTFCRLVYEYTKWIAFCPTKTSPFAHRSQSPRERCFFFHAYSCRYAPGPSTNRLQGVFSMTALSQSHAR